MAPTPTDVLRIRQGEAIRARRLHLGMTATALAGIVGVSKATVSQWEHGSISPTLARQIDIAAALNTSHASLFGVD